MTTNTQMSEVRELTMDEADRVSGGNPIVIGFVAGWLGNKVLDKVLGNISIADMLEKLADEKKGKQKQ